MNIQIFETPRKSEFISRDVINRLTLLFIPIPYLRSIFTSLFGKISTFSIQKISYVLLIFGIKLLLPNFIDILIVEHIFVKKKTLWDLG